MATRSHDRVLGAHTVEVSIPRRIALLSRTLQPKSNLFGKRENVSNVCGQGTWRVIAAVTNTVIYADLGVITPLYVKLKNRLVAIQNGTPAEEEIKEFRIHLCKLQLQACSST